MDIGSIYTAQIFLIYAATIGNRIIFMVDTRDTLYSVYTDAVSHTAATFSPSDSRRVQQTHPVV